MSELRACRPEDIPEVARLFQKTFRNPKKPAPRSLEHCLRDVVFGHTEPDPELPSRVYVGDDGNIAGFMGVLPLSMEFKGRKIRAAVPNSLAVDDPKKHPLAGAKLVRAFLSGPQDISISEPINGPAQALWEKLGGVCIPSESMEWMRLFRPAGFVLSMLGGSLPIRLMRPPARLFDRIADKLSRGVFSFQTPRSFHRDEDASDEALIAHIPEFSGAYALHPAWSGTALTWMLSHAAYNTARGVLQRRIVYGANDRALGCYLYHGRPGGIAWMLQVLAREGAVEPVIDAMFAHAFNHGAVAIKGRTQLRFLDPLMRKHCFFFRRHSAMVHARDPELIAAVKTGAAVTSGFAAESWLRLSGDRFS